MYTLNKIEDWKAYINNKREKIYPFRRLIGQLVQSAGRASSFDIQPEAPNRRAASILDEIKSPHEAHATSAPTPNDTSTELPTMGNRDRADSAASAPAALDRRGGIQDDSKIDIKYVSKLHYLLGIGIEGVLQYTEDLFKDRIYIRDLNAITHNVNTHYQIIAMQYLKLTKQNPEYEDVKEAVLLVYLAIIDYKFEKDIENEWASSFIEKQPKYFQTQLADEVCDKVILAGVMSYLYDTVINAYALSKEQSFLRFCGIPLSKLDWRVSSPLAMIGANKSTRAIKMAKNMPLSIAELAGIVVGIPTLLSLMQLAYFYYRRHRDNKRLEAATGGNTDEELRPLMPPMDYNPLLRIRPHTRKEKAALAKRVNWQVIILMSIYMTAIKLVFEAYYGISLDTYLTTKTKGWIPSGITDYLLIVVSSFLVEAILEGLDAI